MTDSNLVRLAYVEESVWGTTPATPALRALRYTGADLRYSPTTTESAEIITDRQVTDLIQTSARVNGSYNFELSYREHDEFFAGALCSSWVNTPEVENITADSLITGVTDTNDTYTVASGGTVFVPGYIVRASGFLPATNNRTFVVGSSTATTVVAAGTPTLTDETAPPAGARLKVVGVSGVAGDITATATGLAATTLNFTTLGLTPGQLIKVGGTATGDRFATEVLNTWVRVTSVAAQALTLHERPAGWTTDAGAGKTIKLWFGDTLKNGLTNRSWTIEMGFLGQTTPSYVPLTGLVPDNLSLTVQPGQVVNGSVSFLGRTAAVASTTPLDASVDDSRSGNVINAVSDVPKIAEGGTVIAGPSYALEWSINTTNSLREQTAIGVMGLVGVGKGKFRVTGRLSFYFEDVTIYNKLVNNTTTSISSVFGKNNQAYGVYLPRIKLSGGSPTPGGSDQDVVLEMDFTAMKDTTITQKTMLMDRLEYYEA